MLRNVTRKNDKELKNNKYVVEKCNVFIVYASKKEELQKNITNLLHFICKYCIKIEIWYNKFRILQIQDILNKKEKIIK